MNALVSDQLAETSHCAPTVAGAVSCGIGAPLMVKLLPGSVSNAALNAGLPMKSCAQAARPIYNSAVGRWRAYEQHLGPLPDALGAR